MTLQEIIKGSKVIDAGFGVYALESIQDELDIEFYINESWTPSQCEIFLNDFEVILSSEVKSELDEYLIMEAGLLADEDTGLLTDEEAYAIHNKSISELSEYHRMTL